MRNSIGILLVFFLFQFLATSSALLISGVSLNEMQEMSSEQQQSFNVVLCYTMLAGNLLMIGVLYVLKYVRKNMFRSFFIDETEENQQVSPIECYVVFLGHSRLLALFCSVEFRTYSASIRRWWQHITFRLSQNKSVVPATSLCRRAIGRRSRLSRGYHATIDTFQAYTIYCCGHKCLVLRTFPW